MSQKKVSAVGDGPATRSSKARHLDEFKRDAVRLVSEEKYSFRAAAKAVNVSEKSLRDWYAKFAPKPVPCYEGCDRYS